MKKSADGGTEPASKPDPSEAILALRGQLDKQPDNQEIRIRLVQAYAAAGRTEEFKAESEVYKRIELERLQSLRTDDAAPAAAPESARAPPGKERIRRFAADASTAQALKALADAYRELRMDPKYLVQLDLELTRQGDRPTPLIHAARLSERYGGARIYFKLEYAAGSDPHLAIATIGQVHLARCLGRRKVVAGVSNVKWGLHMASACAQFGLQSEVFLEKSMVEQHRAQVFQMRLMGAQVTPVDSRDYRAGDVREAGLDAWLRRPHELFLFFGLDSGPEPYPLIARDHNAVIGRECRRQVSVAAHRPPDLLAVRGGQSPDALGLFPAFIEDRQARLVCVEPFTDGGRTADDSYDSYAQPHSDAEQKRMRAVLEGLEFVSVAREISMLDATGRVEQVKVQSRAAITALRDTARLEGLLLGLKTAHVLAWAGQAAAGMSKEQSVVVLVKERGDKDLWDLMRLEGQDV